MYARDLLLQTWQTLDYVQHFFLFSQFTIKKVFLSTMYVHGKYSIVTVRQRLWSWQIGLVYEVRQLIGELLYLFHSQMQFNTLSFTLSHKRLHWQDHKIPGNIQIRASPTPVQRVVVILNAFWSQLLAYWRFVGPLGVTVFGRSRHMLNVVKWTKKFA